MNRPTNLGPALLGVVLLLGSLSASCGRSAAPGSDESSLPTDIPLTNEEKALLDTTDDTTVTSGPVTRDNYKHQLDTLEKSVTAEAGTP